MLHAPLARAAFAVAFALLTAACVIPRIETRSSRQGDVRVIDAVHLLPVEFAPGALGDRTIGDALDANAAEMLERRSVRLVAAIEAAPRLAISARSERVSRRTWSSDPDASALREVEIEEAVVVLRLFDGGGTEPAWLAEARARLPEVDAVFGPTRRAVWLATLREAISALPDAAPSTD